MADPEKTTVVLLDYDKMPRKRFLDALKDHLVSGKSQVYSSKYADPNGEPAELANDGTMLLKFDLVTTAPKEGPRWLIKEADDPTADDENGVNEWKALSSEAFSRIRQATGGHVTQI